MNILSKSVLLISVTVLSACELTPELPADNANTGVSAENSQVSTVVVKKQKKKPVSDLSALNKGKINLDDLEVVAAHDGYGGIDGQENRRVIIDENGREVIVDASGRVVPVKNKKRVKAAGSRGAPPPRKKKARGVHKGNAASQSLLASSKSLMNKGQYRLAAVNAERALRVSPRNPQAYYQLSLIYKKQRNYKQALHFADRGLVQGGASKSLKSALWRVKGDCHAALGDPKAATAARIKAKK